MDHINVCTQLLHIERKRFNSSRNEYRMDMWNEVKKRWLVFGVLLAVLLAVLGPSIGANGGPMHTELFSFFPRSYIFYNAGRRYCRSKTVSKLTLVLSVVHSHIVSPGLCLLAGGIFGGLGVDYRIVRGTRTHFIRNHNCSPNFEEALLWSVGGPCSWLCLSHSDRMSLVVTNYVTSLFVTPLAMMILCGRATIPPLGGIILTALTSATPFLVGAIITRKQHPTHNTTEQHPIQQQILTHQQQNLTHQQQNATENNKKSVYVCCLMLLYVVCCSKLSEAAGVLDVMPVLATLGLELVCVCVSACVCCMYWACGMLQRDDVITFITCSVTKSLDMGWESSACTLSGLSLLPAAFLAPTQALFLAAIHTEHTHKHSLPQ